MTPLAPFGPVDLPVTEQNVGIDPNEQVYVIRADDRTTVLSWDDCMTKIWRYATNLMVEVPTPARGSLAAYDTMRALQEALRRKYERTGEKAVAELSPLLCGLEGERVRATTLDGEVRQFVVAISEGWLPHHVEIRENGPPVRAPLEYHRVEPVTE
jgi:hypothetical protein